MRKALRYELEGVEIKHWQKGEILDSRTKSFKERPWLKIAPSPPCWTLRELPYRLFSKAKWACINLAGIGDIRKEYAMCPNQVSRRGDLVTLTKTDPDPAVRHRTHVLLASLDSPTLQATVDACAVSYASLHRWWGRFLEEGREGLADRPRPGRPRKLPEEVLVLLRSALASSPDAYGYPTTIWTIADLTDLLLRTGWSVSVTTVQRTLHAEGHVYWRPRHALAHRQDCDAVASAARTLATLPKRGLLPPTASTSCPPTSARFVFIPSWIAAGSDEASPPASPPREPTSV